MSFMVGRYINNISINGLEFLLDKKSNIKKFNTRQKAIDFLSNNLNASSEEIEDQFVILKKNKRQRKWT